MCNRRRESGLDDSTKVMVMWCSLRMEQSLAVRRLVQPDLLGKIKSRARAFEGAACICAHQVIW